MVHQRMLALIILAIPIGMGVLGFAWLRESWFDAVDPSVSFPWLKVIFGGAFLLFSLLFMGGFILHRDRKRNLVQPRFRKEDDQMRPQRSR